MDTSRLIPTILGIILITISHGVIDATDPVYSPLTLTDTSGNVAYSNGTINWAALPAGEAYTAGSVDRINEGLRGFYSMVHGFIIAVLPNGIPDEIAEKVMRGQTSDILSNYNEHLTFFIGYAICVIVGLLFILIIPIVTICFCCCRCFCKKCGGRMSQKMDESEKSWKKWLYIVILMITLIFLVAGGVCIFMNNDATSTAVKDLPKTTAANLQDLELFVNNTVEEATHLIQNNYNFLNASLLRDLDNIAYLVGLPLRQDIETNTGVRTTITTGYSLVTSLDNADTALTEIENKKTALETSVTTMEANLNTVESSLDTICASLSCPNYAAAMATGVDSSNFPNLSGPRASMDSAKGTNMTAKLVEAEEELDGIPDTVVTDSQSTVNDIKTKVGNLSDDIDPLMNQIRDINELFVGTNASIDLVKLRKDVDDLADTLETYDKYRWYGGLSLTFVVMVFVILMAGGLTLGMAGTNTRTYPGDRGCLANTGGIFLMISVYMTFIVTFFLMFLTTFPFLLGAPAHRLICFPITDLDELQNLAQIYNDYKVGAGKYFLGDLVLDNENISLTVTGMLRDCNDGKSAWSAFRMAEKFDLADLLNYSKTVDVQSEIDSVNVDLSSTDVYPAALETQLTDLKNAVNINFNQFYTELQNQPTSGDLTQLANDLDTYAAGLSDPAKSNIESEATNIRNIEANEYSDVQDKINDLNTSVASMESAVSTIPTQVDALNDGLNATNIYIQTNTGTVIRNLLNTFANRLLGIADSYAAHTDDGIQTKMGSCKPVWNIYNSILVYSFCHNLMDAVNGFWFAIGWCIFFALIGLIFSVRLAKYFRRMTDMEWSERVDSTTPSKMFADNKVYPEIAPTETKGEWWPQRNNKLSQAEVSECNNSNTLIHTRSNDNDTASLRENGGKGKMIEETEVGKCTNRKVVSVITAVPDQDNGDILVSRLDERQELDLDKGEQKENDKRLVNNYLLVVPPVDINETFNVNGNVEDDDDIYDDESKEIDAFVTEVLDKVLEEELQNMSTANETNTFDEIITQIGDSNKFKDCHHSGNEELDDIHTPERTVAWGDDTEAKSNLNSIDIMKDNQIKFHSSLTEVNC